ncbi:MAG: hypothetical protein LUC97_09515 [Clostridiales bacterium]|nr:hypothetical protein [Clostridiales bacterium]
MDYTEVYGFKKPEDDDYYNVQDFNDNIDIIETELEDRLSLTKGGYMTGIINFGEYGDEIGWIGNYNGNLMVSSTDITLVTECSTTNYYYTSRNGYNFVNIEKVFKPAAVTVAAYLSDDEYKRGADCVSTTETGDKAAIIEAIEACPEGGVVRLLPGEYVITRDLCDGAETKSIDLNKAVTITGGSAAGVVLRQEGEIDVPTVIFKVLAENVSIEDMTLRMQTDSNSEATVLISIMASCTSIRRCVFESEADISCVSNTIQFYYDEDVTTVNPNDESGYILEGVTIEDCRFNVDYPSLVPDESSITTAESQYCDFIRTDNVKISGRIYGNTSAKRFIAFYNSLDDIAYDDDLAVFGCGAVRSGGYYGDEVRSYGA